MNTTNVRNEVVAERIQQSASIIINGDIENVFPLFGPIREMEWAHGWNPTVLYGSGEVEEHMIFETDGPGEKFTWALTQWRTDIHLVEYTVSAADRIWFITVRCEEFGLQTKATVRYMYTGFTHAGNERNKKALRKMFEHHLKDWESAINYYLISGKQLVNS